MQVKFNKFERVAGLFVLSTIIGGLLILVGVAVKQGWFEMKVHYETTLQNADGLRVGTLVQMAGLRAGSVTSVELRSNDVIHVGFEISEKYRDLVRADSVVRTLRPFIISEKVLDISVGDTTKELAAAGSELPSEVTIDIMDLVSGRTLAPHLESFGKMMENLKVIAQTLLDPQRSRDVIKIFDELSPLVKNMNMMAHEVSGLIHDSNKNGKLIHLVNNLAVTTTEVNKMLPEINKIVPELAKIAPEVAKQSPQLAADLAKIASNMAILTDQIQDTLPAIKQTLQEVGPEIPRASRRAMEALDETVVTLKALQRSFILRGNTKEVREEEALRDQSAAPRVPSSLAPNALPPQPGN